MKPEIKAALTLISIVLIIISMFVLPSLFIIPLFAIAAFTAYVTLALLWGLLTHMFGGELMDPEDAIVAPFKFIRKFFKK